MFGTVSIGAAEALARRRKCGHQSTTGTVTQKMWDTGWGEGGLPRRCHMHSVFQKDPMMAILEMNQRAPAGCNPNKRREGTSWEL